MTTLTAPVNTGANFQAMLTRDRHDTRSNAERATETVAEMRRLVIADWAELDDDTELMVPDTAIAYAFARHGAAWEKPEPYIDFGALGPGTLTVGTAALHPDGTITSAPWDRATAMRLYEAWAK